MARDRKTFIAKLTNPDYEVQANAMEEIANMVKDEPQKATELLDEKVVNALNSESYAYFGNKERAYKLQYNGVTGRGGFTYKF